MASRYISKKIQQMMAARRKMWALDMHDAARFTRESSRGWKTSGVDGMRAACWDAAQLIKDKPGAWDAFEALIRAAGEV